MPDHDLQPYTALDLARGPWRLTILQIHYGVQHTLRPGALFSTPVRVPDSDTIELWLQHRGTGERVRAIFRRLAEQWVCPEYGIGCDDATMTRVILSASVA